MQIPTADRVHVQQGCVDDLQVLREKAQMAITQSQSAVSLSKQIRRRRRIDRVLQSDSFGYLMQEVKRESMSRPKQETVQSLLSHRS